MKQVISIICLLYFPVLCFGEPVPFEHVHATGDELAAQFSWGDATKGFTLSALGALSPKSNLPIATLNLPIDNGEWIEQLILQRYENALILAFQTTDGEGARGFICRVKWPQNVIQWCQTIPSFNISASTGMDSIYVGAVGFMGRLDPVSGKYIWRQDGLYEKDHFMNIVCLANENSKVAIFNAGTGKQGADIEQITLDRDTGKIVKTSASVKGEVCK